MFRYEIHISCTSDPDSSLAPSQLASALPGELLSSFASGGCFQARIETTDCLHPGQLASICQEVCPPASGCAVALTGPHAGEVSVIEPSSS
jgi:hypothetical protein